MGKRSVYGYLFIAPFFLIFGFFQLYPILYSLYLSAMRWEGFAEPAFVGVDNYQRLLADQLFYQSIGNTFIIWIVSIIPQLLLALTLAIILNEKFVRGKHFFRAVFYFPNLVTPVTIGVLFSLLFDWQTGSVNNALLTLGMVDEPINWLRRPALARLLNSLVMLWQWFGFNMLLYIAGLQSIPQEIYDAAEVDGASGFQIAIQITIPLLRPVIIFTVITSIIGGMQIFDVPLMLTGRGPNNTTLTMVMYLYETAFQRFRYGYASAIAYVTFVLIAVFSLLSLRLTTRSERNQPATVEIQRSAPTAAEPRRP